MEVSIKLKGTYWDKKPEYKIFIDDQLLKHDFIQAESGVVEAHTFNFDLPESDSPQHKITVELLNKTDDQTVKDQYEDPVNFTIVKDMLLEVTALEIDGLHLGDLLFSESVYKVNHPVSHSGLNEVTDIRHCTCMGWNGKYVFTFESPFYAWLIDRMIQ